MNISIIGKGTSSIITMLVLLQKGHNVTVFYDPDTSPINVGESTTPQIQNLILDVLGISIHQLVDEDIFSYKMGINFVNWGTGNKFHHNFTQSNVAHHFETKTFNHYIHKYLEDRKLVTYIPERVISISYEGEHVTVNEKTFDFAINCAGWEKDENYIEPFFKTVNSAQLFVDELEYDNTHTLHLATEDGWQFGLPFPKRGYFKCGYLYDNNLISHDEVKDKLDKDVYEVFSWNPRYAKEIITHPRIALNGNRLFFLEPLQALSLFYTYTFAHLICEYLDNVCQETKDNINYKYNVNMWEYQLALAYHYQYGSVYPSNFWTNVQSNALNVMRCSFNGNIPVFLMNMERDSRAKNTSYSGIGPFGIKDFLQIHYGMISE